MYVCGTCIFSSGSIRRCREVGRLGTTTGCSSSVSLPIVTTTLETEVQTISRKLKLEGKALGIVQLVNKGEGLEAWRHLKLEYEGKSGNRLAALLRVILNPRAAWEADTRDGRSVVESLNRDSDRNGTLT